MLTAGIALVALLLAATPLAQGTPVAPEESPIAPVVWEVVEMPGDGGTPVPITDAGRYTIQFLPDGTAGIGADCNRATGTYAIDADAIDITLGVTTLALCPPDSRADVFQRLLDEAKTFDQDDDGHLLLTGPEGTLLLRPTLGGVVWEWQRFQGGDDSLVTPRNPRDYTLTFRPEGKLAIQADCNRAFGMYSADAPKIDLKVGGVTRMACPPGSHMDRFLRDLDDVNSFVFRDGGLFLALPVDAGILEFRARYVPPEQATPEAG